MYLFIFTDYLFFSFGQLGVNDDKGKIYIMSNYYFDPPNAKYTRVS